MADLMKDKTDYNKLLNKYGNFTTPVFKIKINGKDVVENLDLRVIDICVVSSVLACGYCKLSISHCYQDEESSFESKVKNGFKLGTIVTIEMGYVSKTETVFKGYVAMLGMELSEDDRRILVTIMDVRRLMMISGKKHQLYNGKNYSDVFQSVMKAYSELCRVSSDATKDGLLVPVSQTSNDYDFVTKELARKGNREFFVFLDQAYFRKYNSNTEPVMKLRYGREILDWKVEFEYLDSEIRVQGFDSKKEEVVSSEKKAKGTLTQNTILTEKEYLIVDSDVDSLEKAENRAEFFATKECMRSCSGTAKLIGIPEIVPGRYIELEKVDSMFNRKYYVTEVRHWITIDGFTTEIEIGGVMR